MNAQDFGAGEQATLHFSDSDFTMVKPGRYVLCAVSGARIPLESLRYWSAPLQEAYAGPAEATKRWLETQAKA